ncbi:MAG: hypothetical protein JWM98_515, partial [Thermoleophilia bacterium]|nr:hypothetical protein [Thermoleophilia bacterium]
MLPTAEHRTTPETAPDEAPLVVGDLGVVVLRALLENGVGYVVSSWRDRPTPIDAAIDDARERILVPRGVVLRRLRSLAALEPIIAAPSGGITGHPPRGAVVFAGRRGLRPALEQFLAIAASGGIVGFCFDDDAARIEDALVIDPEPTAVGIARAIDAAFVASVAAGRPALVVIRERALGLRGAIRVRADRSPVEAAELDAHQRSEAPHATVAEAAEAAGLVAAHRAIAATTPAGERPVLVVSGPLRQAAERALAQVSASLVAAGATPWTDAVAVVDARAPGVVPAAGGAVAAVLADSTAVCVLGARAARVAERIASAVPHPRVTVQPVDPGTARGEQLVGAIAAWVLERAADELDDPARAT